MLSSLQERYLATWFRCDILPVCGRTSARFDAYRSVYLRVDRRTVTSPWSAWFCALMAACLCLPASRMPLFVRLRVSVCVLLRGRLPFRLPLTWRHRLATRVGVCLYYPLPAGLRRFTYTLTTCGRRCSLFRYLLLAAFAGAQRSGAYVPRLFLPCCLLHRVFCCGRRGCRACEHRVACVHPAADRGMSLHARQA